MDGERESLNFLALKNLQSRSRAFAIGGLVFLASGFGLIWIAWKPEFAFRWLLFPALTAGYLLLVFSRNMNANRRAGESQILPTLGLGNNLTLGRGLLVAAMTGFLLLPQPDQWLVWIPGLLYVLSNAADFFDGYLARRWNHATRLGEILDMSFDGLGVLTAALLSIQYGQVPTWYLAVAFAKPLFSFGLWLRRKLNLPVGDLPVRNTRRVFAGLQMGFLAVALLPVFSPPGTHIAAALFGMPLLVGFGLDWLSVSELTHKAKFSFPTRNFISNWLPLGLRILVLFINLISAGLWIRLSSQYGLDFLWLSVINLLLVLLVIGGVLPRISSIFALCMLGFYQLFSPLSTAQIALAAAYIALIYLGSGDLSLWAPEEPLFQKHVGQSRIPNLEPSE